MVVILFRGLYRKLRCSQWGEEIRILYVPRFEPFFMMYKKKLSRLELMGQIVRENK